MLFMATGTSVPDCTSLTVHGQSLETMANFFQLRLRIIIAWCSLQRAGLRAGSPPATGPVPFPARPRRSCSSQQMGLRVQKGGFDSEAARKLKSITMLGRQAGLKQGLRIVLGFLWVS